MERKILSLALSFLLVTSVLAGTVTPASGIPTYYAAVNGKSGSHLWSAVNTIANVGFVSLGYSGLWTAYAKTDVYPADSIGKAGKIWDMYGECNFTYSKDQCGTYNGVCDCYNREHSIPKSWFGGGTSGIGCDIFHLVPTDGKINGTRSNDEFGEVAGAKNYYGNGTGSAGTWSTPKRTIASSPGEVISGSGKVFEPKDQYKGDFARGYMGTIVKWALSGMTTENNFFSGVYDAAHYFGFTKKAVVLMMKWHREDPVSRKEIDRNNGIQQTQGNRNPFIDYPYLAEYIWGEHAGETVDLSQLMSSSDPDFIPGVSDGWRGGGIIPPGPDTIPVDPPVVDTVFYDVTWYVNGAAYTAGNPSTRVADGEHVQTLPTPPASCSETSEQFVGWTRMTLTDPTDIAPDDLFEDASHAPIVEMDAAYNAVFAHVEEHASGAGDSLIWKAPATSGWINDGLMTASSFQVLQAGGSITSPEIDLSALKKITIRMRTYGGKSFNTVTITAAGNIIGNVSTSKGTTMTDVEFTPTQPLSGTGNLIFTSSTSGTKQGPGVESITLEFTGTSYTYSAFLTRCLSEYTVEWLVNDEPYSEGNPSTSVLEGHAIETIPTPPVSCSSTSEQFVGWSTLSLPEPADRAPMDLFSDIEDTPDVEGDVTYNAVFAHVTAVPDIYVWDTTSVIEGWTNYKMMSALRYRVMQSGAYIISPNIDLSALTKITLRMCTHGGTSYNTVNIATEDGIELGSVVATNGTTLTDYVFVPSEPFSDNERLRFTSPTCASRKGPGVALITIETSSHTYYYSDYVTICSSEGPETDVMEVQSQSLQHARKVIHNGQLFIEVDGILYNCFGGRMK